MRSLDWFFIPADADDNGDSLNLAKRTITLSKANEIIRKELANAPMVFRCGTVWDEERFARDTHSARLVDIKELEKP
jgi:hypothetical protein